jgi:hypothetical protein
MAMTAMRTAPAAAAPPSTAMINDSTARCCSSVDRTSDGTNSSEFVKGDEDEKGRVVRNCWEGVKFAVLPARLTEAVRLAEAAAGADSPKCPELRSEADSGSG